MIEVNLLNLLDLKNLKTEELLDLYILNGYNLSMLDRLYNTGKDFSRRLYKKRGIDYNHIKENYLESIRLGYSMNPTLCKNCGKPLEFNKRDHLFCSEACAVSFNNQGVVRNPYGITGIGRLKIEHITWEGTKIYLRSSYEEDYALELDNEKIKYVYEPFKIDYFDEDLKKSRISIPDFYLPDTNEIVEIKSDFTLNVPNLISKFYKYINLGYVPKLILEHKEVDLFHLKEEILDSERLDTIFNRNPRD